MKETSFVLVSLFCISGILPYVQTLLVSKTLSVMPSLLNDFVALMVLIVTSIALAVRTKHPWFPGQGLLYPVVAVAAVVGYFYSLDALQHGRDYWDFRRRQPELETHIARLKKSPTALAAAMAATATVRSRGYPALSQGGVDYDVLPSHILLCTIGGAESESYWGYAYAPTGKKPSAEDESTIGGKFFHWRQLDGPWHVWTRDDQ